MKYRAIVTAALLLMAARAEAAPATNLRLAYSILGTLIAIDTVEPAGSAAAVEALRERFRAAGFPAQDVQVLAPPHHPEKSNLVVRLRGRSNGPVVWTAHLDVVAAEARDWSVPPFTLTEKNGWLYGRGVGDMKGEAAAMTAALIRLKQEDFRPERDILAMFTADEEAAGHANGVRWLLSAHPELFKDALVINPDSGGGGFKDGRKLFYAVQTAEKLYATFTVSATGKAGHSSQPEPDNSIYRLGAALARLSGLKFPVRLNATTRSFLKGSAARESGAKRQDMLALAADPNAAAAAERLSAYPELNALLRTTCVATLLKGGEAENALPRHAEATIQCRLLPGDQVADVERTLTAVVDDPEVRVTVAKTPLAASETIPDRATVGIIRRIVQDLWPATPLVARMDAGGSDSVFTRAAGIPTYGAASIFYEVGDSRHHAPDERISKAAFEDGVEFTYRMMKELSGRSRGRKAEANR
jgi:acetylornithine deacetylase/succinyl-diaminopimelate desuccinylase-like protein